MSKVLLIAGGLFAAFVVFVIVVALWGISVSNKETRMRATIMAKQKDNTSEYDNMWKKISQVAQVTDAQKEALKEIFVQYAQARNGGDSKNLLFKSVKEAIPNVDTTTFNKLMDVIVSSRDSFTMRQKEILDFKREHDIMIDTVPGGWLLSFLGREKINVTIVTSSRTEKAFETGKDDDVDVFQKKQQTGPAEK